MSISPTATVHLIKGADPVLISEKLTEVLTAISDAGPCDQDEFEGTEYELGEVVMAASTPSMFGRRLLIARNASRFGTAELAPLIDWMASPMEGTVLVLVWERPEGASRTNPVPKSLGAAMASAGQLHDVGVPGGRGKDQWVREQIDAMGVRLDRSAVSLVLDRIGDDAGRLVGLRRTLEGAFGPGAQLSAAEIEPFVGAEGSVPPWDLTDAIDRGDARAAVIAARRMVDGGERHPLQVMASIVNHFKQIAALDGAGITSEKDAAALLGMKGSTFPAKKAMNAARSLGSTRVKGAIDLLAEADVHLRGGIGWPPELVLEMLVARLANLSKRRR
jgi:DNA polymerase-3 subunit delta